MVGAAYSKVQALEEGALTTQLEWDTQNEIFGLPTVPNLLLLLAVPLVMH